MNQDAKVPGPGEARTTMLPGGFDGIKHELARMVKFIQEGRKDPLVIEVARKVAEMSQEAARQTGRKVTDDNRDLIHLEGLHAWCQDNFVYVRDPAGIELIQTAPRQLRRLNFPPELASAFWAPIQKLAAAKARVDMKAMKLPDTKMVGDSDEAVIISLALAAALGIQPLRMRLGGVNNIIHYVWGAAHLNGKWHDFDILLPKFYMSASVDLIDEMEVPLD